MIFGSDTPGNSVPATQETVTPQDVIFDVGTNDFEDKVIKASMEKPVLVDFWAPWCGPCKQLTPALENAVRMAGGQVLLAKINMDEHQQLAAMMRVQSVPTVYAFFGGKPVDAFQGNVPESQLQEFIAKLVQIAKQSQPDAIDIPQYLEMGAQALAQNMLAEAQGIFTQILQQDPDNAKAFSGLVRVLIAAGQAEQAKALLEQASPAMQKDPAYSEAQSAVELALNKPEGSSEEFAAKLAGNAEDHQSRYDLAQILFAEGHKDEAIDQLLTIIEKDREWNEDAARKQLLKYFEALGHSDPITLQGRRKLSSLLFS